MRINDNFVRIKIKVYFTINFNKKLAQVNNHNYLCTSTINILNNLKLIFKSKTFIIMQAKQFNKHQQLVYDTVDGITTLCKENAEAVKLIPKLVTYSAMLSTYQGELQSFGSAKVQKSAEKSGLTEAKNEQQTLLVEEYSDYRSRIELYVEESNDKTLKKLLEGTSKTELNRLTASASFTKIQNVLIYLTTFDTKILSDYGIISEELVTMSQGINQQADLLKKQQAAKTNQKSHSDTLNSITAKAIALIFAMDKLMPFYIKRSPNFFDEFVRIKGKLTKKNVKSPAPPNKTDTPTKQSEETVPNIPTTTTT